MDISVAMPLQERTVTSNQKKPAITKKKKNKKNNL